MHPLTSNMQSRRVRTGLVLGILLLGVGLLGGCQQTAGMNHNWWAPPSACAAPAETPRYVDMNDLARRLGLRVDKAGYSLSRLESLDNCVTIFPDPHGAVIINGETLDRPGPLPTRDGKMFVTPVTVDRIASHMRKTPPAKTVAPTAAVAFRSATLGTVMLDAGHGGHDSGAVGKSGSHEKDLVLTMTLRVGELLERRGVNVLYTRDNDTFVELDDRVALANRARPDLFCSIHADASRNGDAKGFTVFCPKRESSGTASYRAGIRLSRQLDGLDPNGRGMRYHDINLRVLEKTTCPALLVELGFLSNGWEEQRLLSRSYQTQLSEALAEGILEHLEAR